MITPLRLLFCIYEKEELYRTHSNTGHRNRPKLLLLVAVVFPFDDELDMGVQKRRTKLGFMRCFQFFQNGVQFWQIQLAS